MDKPKLAREVEIADLSELLEKVRIAYDALKVTLLEDLRGLEPGWSAWVSEKSFGCQRRVALGPSAREALERALDDAPLVPSLVTEAIAKVVQEMLNEGMETAFARDGDRLGRIVPFETWNKLFFLVNDWERAKAKR